MLLGPFFNNPFPDRTASSPLNSVPKWDSDERRVILNMSFPSGHSVNDGIDKDHYLGVSIDLTYPTINSFRAYHQIWTDPFDVPYQGFFWQGAFHFDTVLVMGCTSNHTFASGSLPLWHTFIIHGELYALTTLMML